MSLLRQRFAGLRALLRRLPPVPVAASVRRHARAVRVGAAMMPRVELDEHGIVAEAFVPSKAHPEREPYRLVRSVSGRWSHDDSRCEGWTNTQHCYHVEALNMTIDDDTSSTALTTVSPSVLAQMDALDEQAVIARLSGGLAEVSKRWVYSFPQGGSTVTGLSIDGVQEAARHLSSQGEAITQDWVRLDTQNEREAYFTAKAIRFAVSQDGQRAEVDSAIRAKRQPKWRKRKDGKGEDFIDFWYEIGVAKALRNAVEALLPEAIKQHMIKFAGQTNGVAPPPPARAPSQPRPERVRTTPAPQQPLPASPALDARKTLRDLLTTVSETTDASFWENFKLALKAKYPKAYDGGLVIRNLTDAQVTELCANIRQNVLGEPPLPEEER